MKLWLKIVALIGVLTGAGLSVRAQMAVPPPMPAYQPLADQQLDQLLGPIALYPDPLIAQILPASTLPTQIVLADRYVTGSGDPNQIDQQPWDASVQALARYPSVLKWMDDNLNWTTELGEAFLNQQQDVMDSIQRLRQSAANLGNLQSTPQQQVINDGGDIEIVPADPDVIYVPEYEPDQVYYQTPYGTPFISFGIACPIGLWLNCDFDWRNHNIFVWDRNHPRPANWWHEPAHQVPVHTTVWRPENHPGAVAAYHGDRGYAVPIRQPVVRQPVVATVGHSMSDSVVPRQTPVTMARPEAPVARPAPAPVEHFAPASRPEGNGAFIGVQSSSDTRNYSNRGQQSIQTITHSAPVSRPEPVSRPAPFGGGGGGGGGHSGGSQPRH
jgi:Protein of unknown function (DUF3300)